MPNIQITQLYALTTGLLGRKASFFSSAFLVVVSLRCDGEPSDFDDAVKI